MIQNLFLVRKEKKDSSDDRIKTLSLDPRLLMVLTVIDSGLPGRALRRLRELDSQMLNKKTLKLYLEALAAIDAAHPAVTRLVEACLKDQERQGNSLNN